MKSIAELNFGFGDAINYARRENRKFFSQLFVHTIELDQLCTPNIFFLMGEKGTGKTAYATYIANNHYKENASVIKNIGETEYLKFVRLKQLRQLELSDFENIWKVILCLIISESVSEKDFVFRIGQPSRVLKKSG